MVYVLQDGFKVLIIAMQCYHVRLQDVTLNSHSFQPVIHNNNDTFFSFIQLKNKICSRCKQRKQQQMQQQTTQPVVHKFNMR